jgi:glycosyltransferase involved in cell wall biosynthesis
VTAKTAVRVLFVGSVTELGGAETALLGLLRHLDRERVRSAYASLEFGDGALPRLVEALGVPVRRLPAGRLRELGRTAAKVRALARLIREEKIDVVVSNTGHPLLVARPAAVLTGRPCAWWVHGFQPDDPLRGEWISVAQRWLGANLLLANSEHTARLLRGNFPNCPRVEVVRPGVDIERFHPAAAEGQHARRELGIGPGHHLAGIFGRLQPWKGQHVFLEAAARVTQRFPECRFAVVGGSLFGLDREYAEQLRRRAEQPDLRGRVLFLGHREDVNTLMNACDVMVHASVEPEPWGMVVAEAMAAGRAVVAAAAGGPLEMISHGRAGLLTPPGDADTLADVVAELLFDLELRQATGREARLHAEREFSAARTADQFTAAVQTLCRKSQVAAIRS